jgi:hypothetical protein
MGPAPSVVGDSPAGRRWYVQPPAGTPFSLIEARTFSLIEARTFSAVVPYAVADLPGDRSPGFPRAGPRRGMGGREGAGPNGPEILGPESASGG